MKASENSFLEGGPGLIGLARDPNVEATLRAGPSESRTPASAYCQPTCWVGSAPRREVAAISARSL